MLRKVNSQVQGYRAVDGAGVSLVRVLGNETTDVYDPFLMLDAFDSTDPADYVAGFPMHPHRGIETVTFLSKGTIRPRRPPGHQGGHPRWRGPVAHRRFGRLPFRDAPAGRAHAGRAAVAQHPRTPQDDRGPVLPRHSQRRDSGISARCGKAAPCRRLVPGSFGNPGQVLAARFLRHPPGAARKGGTGRAGRQQIRHGLHARRRRGGERYAGCRKDRRQAGRRRHGDHRGRRRADRDSVHVLGAARRAYRLVRPDSS